MEILRFSASVAERIGKRPYDVRLASSIAVAAGEGEARAYVVYLEPGGVIGSHEAGSARSSSRSPAAVGLQAVTISASRYVRARRPSSVEVRCIRRAAKAE